MKIVFVIKAMSLPGGGAERVLATVANGLARRDHEVTIVSRDEPDSIDFYPIDGVTRIRLGGLAGGKLGRASDFIDWLPKLRNTIKAARPAVAVGFMHSSYIPLGVTLAGTGIPVIASEHTVYEHYRSRPAERALLRLVPWFSQEITVVSHQARATFPPFLRPKMVVIPNPVSLAAGASASQPRTGRRLAVAIGRLDAAKDHATLIAAFARIAPHCPEWDLEIAGEGEARAALETQIAELDLGDRVRLLGVADAAALLRRADLFAMASRYESFGLATAEALAAGVPAIGFADCAGTNELIIDGVNGLLIDPSGGRSQAFAWGLAKLMKNKHLRLQLAVNAPNSLARFEESAVVSEWERMLDAASRR